MTPALDPDLPLAPMSSAADHESPPADHLARRHAHLSRAIRAAQQMAHARELGVRAGGLPGRLFFCAGFTPTACFVALQHRIIAPTANQPLTLALRYPILLSRRNPASDGVLK